MNDKKRLEVTLTDPTNSKKEVTYKLRRFTPETFEQYQEHDQDNTDAATRAMMPYMKEESVPEDPEGRLTYMREARKVGAQERIAGTYRLLQWAIDPTTISVDEHRRWIEEPVMVPASENGDGEMVVNPHWVLLGNDLSECERALEAFRTLLGVKR